MSCVHPDDKELVTSTVQNAVLSGQPFDYYLRVIHPDGSIHTHHARGRLVRDAAGAPFRMVGTGQDITRVLALETERTALEVAAVASSRTRFLSEATDELYASLDYESRLAELANLIVPTIGDWCAVDILQPDDTFRRVAVVHSDPEKSGSPSNSPMSIPKTPIRPRAACRFCAPEPLRSWPK